MLREIFPVESYDKNLRLEYRIRYELGKPRYEPDECRQLRLTYGCSVSRLAATDERRAHRGRSLSRRYADHDGRRRVHHQCRWRRVVVSQLHRSPGVDFVADTESGEAKTSQLPNHPRAMRQLDRVKYLEREDTLSVRIDQERQVFGHDAAAGDGSEIYTAIPIYCGFSIPPPSEKIVDGRSAAKIEGKIAVEDIVYPAGTEKAGEIISAESRWSAKRSRKMRLS